MHKGVRKKYRDKDRQEKSSEKEGSKRAKLQVPVNLLSWQQLTIKMEHKCSSNKFCVL